MRHNLRVAIDTKFGTQLACARAVGLHPVRLNRLCRGWVDPTVIERERLTSVLGADPVWLFSTLTLIPKPAKTHAADLQVSHV